jgi:peptide chain release factor 2
MAREVYELRVNCNSSTKRVNDLKECLNINSLLSEIKELEEESNGENFWNDNKRAKQVLKKLNKDRENIEQITKLENWYNDIQELLESNDDEMLEMADEELINADLLLEKMELEILLSGPFDSNNAILEIHPGAGGTESHDWADMLFRMYTRWCEKNNCKVDVLDYLSGEEAGIKSVTFEIKGDNIYGLLKGEKGVHRLVRISPFDSSKRRHTSFASVDVTPKFDEDIEIEIKEEEIRIDTYRASGAGGQHINKTDSAVRITHLPTGIVVSCQNQRSQIQNKEYCMNILKGKLYQKMMLEKKQELDKIKGENMANEWGSQIRSYVFCPYTMVKDHRSNHEVSDVRKVMDGEIDGFISAYLKMGD